MDEDEDTVMGDSHTVSALTSNPALTQTLPTNLSRHPTPTLTPSFNPQASTSPSPGSDQSPSRGSGMGPPDRLNKTSDTGSSSADQFLKRDSLVESNSDWSDEEEMLKPGLPLASLATGLCYDHRMRYHCEVSPRSDVHPEDPRRIYYIYKELCRAGLVDDDEAPRPLAPKTLQRIAARDATEDEIITVHTESHYAFVRSTKEMSNEELIKMESERDSIYYNKLTFACSLLSAGGAIETCMAVAQRRVKNAIAVIRPPGHHAEVDDAMGFCLFNNVSVAARVCQNKLGDSCRKILILDWDVHHGNGIQKAFYDDPNVLYISIHVYQNAKFYPGSTAADWDFCGKGAGVGKNVNIPWADQGMGDGDYMYAFQELVMPIAQEFDPDLVIIAAGFDAAAGDVLGGCFVSPACYAQMTHMLMTLAQGKLAVCLEGGYNFKSISKSALAVTKTLMGEPPDRLMGVLATDSAIETVRRVRSIQSKHWACLYPKTAGQAALGNRLHDKLRLLQSNQLFESCKLTPLYIYRTGISQSFDKQVLASPNYNKAVPLVVIFHDPPEVIGEAHPVSNKMEAHNVWIADSLENYIKWITDKGYGVIDVNIPKHVTRETSLGTYEGEDEDRPTATEELAAYLWDNYITNSDCTDIFLLGVGNAFFGVVNLLINKENLYKRVNGVISFVAENPVRAVASHTQTWLSKWYRENSLVFVAGSHGIWGINERRPSKRYGQLFKSPKSGLNEMLDEHKEAVFTWISDRADAADGETEDEDA